MASATEKENMNTSGMYEKWRSTEGHKKVLEFKETKRNNVILIFVLLNLMCRLSCLADLKDFLQSVL